MHLRKMNQHLACSAVSDGSALCYQDFKNEVDDFALMSHEIKKGQKK